MNKNKENHLKNIIISVNTSLIEALKIMDINNIKLLLVYQENNFKSLLSIGDIQRGLLKGKSFDTPVSDILRENIRVCNTNNSITEIKEIMLSLRAECMPVVDEANQLVDIYFWDDFFAAETRILSTPVDNPVVIMAGGLGSRLKPLTNVIPKPLIPVGDKTIIERIIDKYIEIGVTNFHTTVNYKHEMIKFYFDQLDNKKYNISFHLEDKPLGTAGSLHLLEDKINTTFFVNNCDIVIDQDYREILDYHITNKNEITLVAAIMNYAIPYGIVEIGEQGILENIKEKPDYTYFINSGMYILEPHLLRTIPRNEFYHITHLIDDVRKRNGRIGVYPVSEKSWFDIGEWDTYHNTLENFEKRFISK